MVIYLSSIQENSHIETNYLKIPSQHIGLEFNLKSKRHHFEWVLGAQHVSNHYGLNYTFYAANTDQISVKQDRIRLNTNGLGLKFGIKLPLNSFISLQAAMGFWLTYSPKDENLKSVNETVYSYYLDNNGNPIGQYLFVYNMHISSGGLYPQVFIPEIKLDFKVYKDLCLSLGAQFKCFDLDKESGYMDVRITGNDQPSYVISNDLIHFSRIKRTEFNYY